MKLSLEEFKTKYDTLSEEDKIKTLKILNLF